MNFIAFDVETANSDPKSICQVGLAVFENGQLKEKWGTYVNPKSHFDWMNIEIHGITSNMVKDAPTISELHSTLSKYFNNNTVVTYTAFDRSAISRNNLDFDCDWLDAAMVVRRTWEKVAYSGYGLANVCAMNDVIMDNHHDAVSDAVAAGNILVKAMQHHGINIDGAKKLVGKKIVSLIAKGQLSDKPKADEIIIEGGNPDGNWYGDILCFTGELSIPRVQASIIASQYGFNVKNSVTKKTTFLVKGFQDPSKLNGKNLSSKEEKALDAIKAGQDMIIIGENEFFELIQG
ncbi:exonuclease domain-containing protein [Acinetobacter sp. ANC 3791]|uniref:exonuclease domain-containing protein n=1 Tax=Acinetobacter sp. ANC 3791 TaxID=2529836 RepID=UPI00103FF134|nr:exonuclease domain-containing protein [Acinetobacter sp. ANC 3791]TCB83327.1 transposase [Acinetobacter sp. ANC 3791]